MLMWSAVLALAASLLVLGPLAESVPAWAGEVAMLLIAVSAFVLVCLLETAGKADRGAE
ncbi:MAG TPA: hypothetical protein VGU45_09985 [Microvirga sp.]|jgi:hypothetical protein|nr:hypothetical protein [Microvirga sp.]